MQESPTPIENQNNTKNEKVSGIAEAIEREFPPRAWPASREINRHTDDTHLFEVWPKVIKSLSERGEFQAGDVRVGLVVGAGGAPSTFPELLPQLDLLVFADYDQRVLDWVKSTLQNLDKYPKADLYERLVYSDSNPLLQERGSNYGANIYTGEIESWGGFHFLDSDQRYRMARQSYIQARDEGKKICCANVDLGNPQSCARLTEVLGSDSRIVYSNLTNVAVYVAVDAFRKGERYSYVEEAQASYKDALRLLPFDQDAVMQFSDTLNKGGLPKADMIVGLENYIEKAVRRIPV